METTRTVHTLRPGFVLLVLLCTFCGCWGYRAVRAALIYPPLLHPPKQPIGI